MHMISRRKVLSTALLISIVACGVTPVLADKSPVKMTKLSGTVMPSTSEPSQYVLEGIASHLGEFRAYGEVEFGRGEDEGSMIGTGPVVFEASNGDLLVGVAIWEMDSPVDGVSDAGIHFAWRDSVEFSDGTVVASSGHFVTNRPPGLVVVVSAETLVDLLIKIIFRH